MAEFANLCSDDISERCQPLPLMDYAAQPEPLRQFYFEEASKGAIVIEATKFAIEPGVSSLSLAKHVIDAEHAIQLFCNGADISIMGINSSHYPLYRRYGYELVPGTSEFELKGVKGITVYLRRSAIQQHIRQKLMRMALAYMETGAVCFNPAEPNNLYAPAVQPEVRNEAVRLAA